MSHFLFCITISAPTHRFQLRRRRPAASWAVVELVYGAAEAAGPETEASDTSWAAPASSPRWTVSSGSTETASPSHPPAPQTPGWDPSLHLVSDSRESRNNTAEWRHVLFSSFSYLGPPLPPSAGRACAPRSSGRRWPRQPGSDRDVTFRSCCCCWHCCRDRRGNWERWSCDPARVSPGSSPPADTSPPVFNHILICNKQRQRVKDRKRLHELCWGGNVGVKLGMI